MATRSWRDSEAGELAGELRPPKALQPKWTLPAWKGLVPLSIAEDMRHVSPLCAPRRHRLRVARLDDGKCLLACIACGPSAGASPRQLLAECPGKFASPGLARQRQRLLSGKHPHSSHGEGAKINSMGLPSVAQVAWLLDDIKPTPPRPSSSPHRLVAGMGRVELLQRFGVQEKEDLDWWARRARTKPVALEDEGSDVDVV